MNAEWKEKLRKLYSEIDEHLSDKARDCKGCDKCCTNTSIPYRGIEIDYIYEYLFDLNQVDLYEELVNLGFNWGSPGTDCLFYKKHGRECFIYPARPYNCRVIGQYADSQVGLDPECVYKESAIVVERDRILETLPFFREYQELASGYNSYLKPGADDNKG